MEESDPRSVKKTKTNSLAKANTTTKSGQISHDKKNKRAITNKANKTKKQTESQKANNVAIENHMALRKRIRKKLSEVLQVGTKEAKARSLALSIEFELGKAYKIASSEYRDKYRLLKTSLAELDKLRATVMNGDIAISRLVLMDAIQLRNETGERNNINSRTDVLLEPNSKTIESLTSTSDADNPNIVLPTINASDVPSAEEASQISKSTDVHVSNRNNNDPRVSKAIAADFMDISDDEGDDSLPKKISLTQTTGLKPVSIKISKEEEVWNGKVQKMSKHGQIKNTFNNITFFQKNSALAGTDVRHFDLPNSLVMKGRCEMREVYSHIKKYSKKNISVIYAKTLSDETRMDLKNELTFQKPAAYISVNGNHLFIVLVELLKGLNWI